jgi:nucleosome assembly protein 1-like 1
MKTLQKKYDSKALPLYKSANEIIDGSRLPNEEELKDVDIYLKEEEVPQKNQALTSEPISGYWFRALRNSDIIA